VIVKEKKSKLYLKIKLGSFICALFLWLFVVLNNTYNYNVDIPIEIENLRAGKILAETIPQKMTVNFHGKGSYLLAMRYLKSSAGRFRMDLNTINRFWICPVGNYPDWIILPRGLRSEIQVREIVSPDTIRIVLDDKDQKLVPVDYSNIDIEPRAGYVVVGEVELTPDSVLISGPVRTIRNIRSVQTKPYRFENKTRDISGEVELESLSSELLTLNFQKVRFFAHIQKLGERMIDDVEIKVENNPGNLSVNVEPSFVRLKIIGGVEIIGAVDYDDIEAYVNFPLGLQRGNSINAQVNVNLPENVMRYESTPAEVKISIR